MNRRTAESAGGGQNIEVQNIVSFFLKTSAVSAEGGFDIVLRTPHPAGGSPVSIFKIQESESQNLFAVTLKFPILAYHPSPWRFCP